MKGLRIAASGLLIMAAFGMFAVTKSTVDGLIYTVLEDGTAEVAMDSTVTPLPTSVTIPSDVTIEGKEYTVSKIADKGFSDNTDLSSVTLPSTIKTIGTNAFYNCSSLKSIELPDGLETIETGAFASYGGAGLQSITIPATVSGIGARAFYHAPLEKVIIEGAVDSPVLNIGSEAFAGLAKPIDEIEVGRTTPPVFPDDAFNASEYNNTKITFIGLAEGMSYLYGHSDGWKNFKNLVITGIDSVGADQAEGEAATPVYTLEGRYVGMALDGAAPGIYIRGGRKVMVK